jgi:hypothetical protein
MSGKLTTTLGPIRKIVKRLDNGASTLWDVLECGHAIRYDKAIYENRRCALCRDAVVTEVRLAKESRGGR